MTTYAVMQTRIAGELFRDDLSSQIKNAINEAIGTWEGQRFAFNEKRYLINTVTGQEYYDFIAPTLLTSTGAQVGVGETVLELDSITTTVSNWPYPLYPRTQQWFDQYAGPTYNGQPDSYAIFGNQLRLFPLPDGGGPGVGGAYPLNLSTLARLGPNPLTADADTNAWMTEGEPLIRQQAKLILYRDVLRDAEGISGAMAAIPEAEWRLKRLMAAKAYTGRQAAWRL